jgi:acyl-CoA reductase-like NAD-dependent aldehyde dehydrogenase
MVATASNIETPPILVGGELRAARSGATLDSLNPATGELIARVPRCDARDVADAVAAARSAFVPWRATPAAERAELVLALARYVVDHGERLARLDVIDNGSPIREMRKDVDLAVSWMRHFAGLALHLRGETIPTGHDRVNYTLRDPFGVVGRIIPFNHPLAFAASKIAAPLIAGNTVVLKPSEHTSLSALSLAEAMRDIFPAGVVNVVTGTGAEAGDALVAHPDVRRLAFIGHPDTGRAIQARAAAVCVKTVTLELGGKNPLVVFPDADLDDAVEGALRGMNFTWQGQSCGSTSRLLLHEDIHDEVVERLAARMDELRSGDPLDEATDTGAIVNAAQHAKVTSAIALGRSEGARLVTGGGPPKGERFARGLFVRPTLFDGVRPDSGLAQEEIFGPVLAALRFSSYDEAVRIANGVRFGLTASVWTRDLRTAHAFARDVEAGYVWVNDASRHLLGAPFGGVKDSGVGREEDHEELASYTQVKNVNVRFA